MAKPTVYMWTDPGAPQINANNVSSYQAMFQAVLIDGYGDKEPPGSGLNKWSIPFSSSSSFILKQGGTQDRKCCIKLWSAYNSTSTRYGNWMRIEKADDYLDLNSPVGRWEASASNHQVGVGLCSSYSYHIPWIIVATERTIICHFGSNNAGTDSLLYDNALYYGVSHHQWMFGDYEPYDPTMTANQMCAHAAASTTSEYDRAQGILNSSGYYGFSNDNGDPRVVCRGNHNDELGCYKMVYLCTRAMNSTNFYSAGEPNSYALPAYPNKLDGGLYLEPSRVFADDGILGVIPGVLFPIQRVPFPSTGVVRTLKGTGNYAGATLHAFESRCYDSESNTYNGQYFIHDGEWGVD